MTVLENKKRLLNIIELLVIAALAAFLIIMLTAGSSREVPMDSIRQHMEAQQGIEALLQKSDSAVNSAFGFVPSAYVYYRSDNVMDVSELLIVHTSDDLEMEKLENAVSGHLETQIDNYTGYGTNQVDLLEHAIMAEKGSYYFFAVGEQAEEWQDAFLKLIG